VTISSQFVQELLSRTDIIEVISPHVALKKAGMHHKGLCPFHGEKTPSFLVSPTKQIYHCFGCGVHGDAVGFVMAYNGWGFIEAVQNMAQQIGLSVPQDTRSPQEHEQARQSKARNTLLAGVLEQANTYYRQQLQTTEKAKQYLQRRGLTDEIITEFSLGYAPMGWNNLASALALEDQAQLQACGLLIIPTPETTQESGTQLGTPQTATALTPRKNKAYSRFRDRIMFPIRSIQGEIIGFGGRIIDQGEPKYLNSPETSLFIKGNELYGLYEARTGLRKKGYALVVEGYMDVVALAQLGFPNAVATLGTACSSQHMQKLFRFTESVVFSFDGDTAGQRAAQRALQVCLPYANDTRSIRFLFLPAEHDPDSFIRTHGPQAFEEKVEQAIALSQQLIESSKQGCDLKTAEGRAKLLVNAKPLWASIAPGALKMQLLTQLASTSGLSSADLSELWQTHKQAKDQSRGTPAIDSRNTHPQNAKRSGLMGRFSSPGTHRSAPMSLADSALRMLLLHSGWWTRLSADDHELLYRLPEPHNELCAWLERYLHEHEAPSWAVCEQALSGTQWASLLPALIPASALQDEMDFSDLERVLDRLWVEQLQQEQQALIKQVTTDTNALQKWREVDAHRRRRLSRLTQITPPIALTK
jgi:DNA primase